MFHVDDLIKLAEKVSPINCPKMELAKKFRVKDFKNPVQFLGIELDASSETSLLIRFGKAITHATSPLQKGISLSSPKAKCVALSHATNTM